MKAVSFYCSIIANNSFERDACYAGASHAPLKLGDEWDMPVLDRVRLQALARYHEKVAEKRFKKMGYTVQWLDTQGPRKRPEFLVENTAGPLLICEVKTQFSGGYLRNRGAHISTEDPALPNTGMFSWDIDFGPMYHDLSDAVGKYNHLVEDRPDLAGTPLLVIFFFDELADIFDFFPARMEEHPDVSAIAVIEINHAIRQKQDSMSLEELEGVMKSGVMKGFPPPSKELRLVLNEVASRPLPTHFVDSCLK